MSTYTKDPGIHNHGPESLLSGYSSLSRSTPLPYPVNEVRPIYHEAPASYLDTGAVSPNLTSFSPSKGTEQSKINVLFTMMYDITESNSPRLFLTFGSSKCSTTAHKDPQKTAPYAYQISTSVPPFQTTGWRSLTVPISMIIETGQGVILNKMFVGEFEYTDLETSYGSDRSNSSGSCFSSVEPSKKRKSSGDLSELMNSPRKRLSCQQLRTKEEYTNYQYTNTNSSSPYSYLPSSNFYVPSSTPSYCSLQPGISQGLKSTKLMQHGSLPSETSMSPTMKVQSLQPRNWPSYSNIWQNSFQSSGISSNPTSRNASISSISSPSILANPPLFRTSTFQQNSNPTDPSYFRISKQFNTYSLYPDEAKIEIRGDLNSIVQNWSDEEINCRRRLVLFNRTQSGSTISTTFCPIGPDERPKDSICISCIYWEEKGDFFITSVDTIYLLQKLVAAQFTVEEKNRIRRNLEGFRPMTVSKGKRESEQFFKVIMAFPSPKPRNIEKDIKIFRWSDLYGALKKIIGKYSASPSSTLPTISPIPPSINNSGYSNDNSSSLSFTYDHNRPTSSRSLTSSIASTTAPPTRVLTPRCNDKGITANMQTVPTSENDLPDTRIPFISDLNQNLWHNSLHQLQHVQITPRTQGDYNR